MLNPEVQSNAPFLYPALPLDPVTDKLQVLINNLAHVIEGTFSVSDLRSPIKEKISFVQRALADREITPERTECIGTLKSLDRKLDREGQGKSMFLTIVNVATVALALFLGAPIAMGVIALALLGEPTAVFILAATAFGVIVWNTTSSTRPMEPPAEISYQDVVDKLTENLNQI